MRISYFLLYHYSLSANARLSTLVVSLPPRLALPEDNEELKDKLALEADRLPNDVVESKMKDALEQQEKDLTTAMEGTPRLACQKAILERCVHFPRASACLFPHLLNAPFLALSFLNSGINSQRSTSSEPRCWPGTIQKR